MKRGVSSWMPLCVEAAYAAYERANKGRRGRDPVSVMALAEPMAEVMAKTFGKLETGYVRAGKFPLPPDNVFGINPVDVYRAQGNVPGGGINKPVKIRMFKAVKGRFGS